MDVNPNISASLDIIPEIDMNKSKPWSNRTQNGLLQHQISSNGPKWSETVKNYRKWVKISNFFYKIVKILKFSYHFEFLPTIVHLSSELQKQIMGASSSRIPPCLIQVNSIAPLFHFDIKILIFHGQFNFLGHPNLGISSHMEIGNFSTYRVGCMHKNAYIHECFPNRRI